MFENENSGKRTGEIIRQLRKQANLTQEQLGEVLGVKKSAIAKYENGRVENLKRITIEKLSDFFEVPPSTILGINAEDSEALAPLDIIYDDFFPLHYSTNLSAGTLMELLDSEPDGIVYVPIKFQKLKKHLVAFKINGESMNRVFLNQSIIVVLKHSYSNETYKNGTPVVVFINGDAFVKRFYFKDNQIILMPDSTEFHKPYIFDVKEMHDYIEHFQIIGKVVWYCPPDDVLEKK